MIPWSKRKIMKLSVWFTLPLVMLLGLGTARAGLCDVPFMHDGGQVQLSGSGFLALGADLAFSDVRKSGGDQCSARVRGRASVALAGLPAGKPDIDYIMTVRDGRASFQRDDGQGGLEPVKGSFDLRLVGLFSYERNALREGQTFPRQDFQIQLDKRAQADPLRIRTGAKTVGPVQTIETSLGRHECWPIRYQRDIEPTQASFSGISLPIPGINSQVTDWYCPDVQMVMKQESIQNGVPSTVDVTQLK